MSRTYRYTQENHTPKNRQKRSGKNKLEWNTFREQSRDVSEMSKIEGKLRFLATCSEKVSEWTPSFTQAETILESLGEIQTLRKEFNEFVKKP